MGEKGGLSSYTRLVELVRGKLALLPETKSFLTIIMPTQGAGWVGSDTKPYVQHTCRFKTSRQNPQYIPSIPEVMSCSMHFNRSFF